MKNIFCLFLGLFLAFSLVAERAPDYREMYKKKNDSVYSENGEVEYIDSFAIHNPGVIEILRDTAEVKSEEKKESDKSSPENNFTSSWKFYVIMLAFPVMFIGLFLLVFVRGRKKDENSFLANYYLTKIKSFNN